MTDLAFDLKIRGQYKVIGDKENIRFVVPLMQSIPSCAPDWYIGYFMYGIEDDNLTSVACLIDPNNGRVMIDKKDKTMGYINGEIYE